jgi:pyridinium-3,5-bisthiocarboxylic acid mononucleotide nickel chelatase
MKGLDKLISHPPPNFEHIDDEMIKMEVNLDDISGEWLGYVMDLLFEAGANDVFYIPIYMKKNRPGILLQILCSFKKIDKMKDILFKETTTLGVRYYPLTVHRMERRFQKVLTQWGSITVKEGIYDGQVIQRAPEFEECKKIAELYNIPLKKVYEQVWKEIDRKT